MPAWRARWCTEDGLVYAGKCSCFWLRVVVVEPFVSRVLKGFVGGEDGVVTALGVKNAQSCHEDEAQGPASVWQ